MTTRHIGTCQICEAEQKLHNGCLVHHGYKRPGDGSIYGDCPGVGQEPYEVSAKFAAFYAESLRPSLAANIARAADLRAGKIARLTEVRPNRAGKIVMVEFIAGVTEPFLFARKVDDAVHTVDYMARQIEREIVRLVARVAAWAPKAVRTVEEAVAQEKAAKGVRASERAAVKAVRDAKKAATAARAEALAAKRAAIVASLCADFIRFAETGDRASAKALHAKIYAGKAYPWLWGHEIDCDAALISLGLADPARINGAGRACWIAPSEVK